MAKERDIDFEIIKSMSEEQQAQAYYTLAKRANQRFRDIENKAGLHSGAVNKARKFLSETYGRNTFIQSKKLSGIELKENLETLERFYKSKTATSKGIKQANKKAIKTLNENFESEEINPTEVRKRFKKILKDKKSKDSFYDFLSSEQFKTLSKYADSNQIIEDYIDANSTLTYTTQQNESLTYIANKFGTSKEELQRINNLDETTDSIKRGENIIIHEKYSLEKILEGYQEFLTNDITFEEVQERRNRGGGELLH